MSTKAIGTTVFSLELARSKFSNAPPYLIKYPGGNSNFSSNTF
jgi:hypothetical protein